MRRMLFFVLVVLVATAAGAPVWGASPVKVSILPACVQARMGDKVTFTGIITNDSDKAMTGIIAYISLANVTRGKEAPMDLEDWSANKAAKIEILSPHETLEIKWPMRLIDSGNYIAYVTVVAADSETPVSSAVSRLEIRRVLRLNPNNVLPVAFGEPLIIGLMFGLVRFRRKRASR